MTYCYAELADSSLAVATHYANTRRNRQVESAWMANYTVKRVPRTKVVTHPSINRVRRKSTLKVNINELPDLNLCRNRHQCDSVPFFQPHSTESSQSGDERRYPGVSRAQPRPSTFCLSDVAKAIPRAHARPTAERRARNEHIEARRRRRWTSLNQRMSIE